MNDGTWAALGLVGALAAAAAIRGRGERNERGAPYVLAIHRRFGPGLEGRGHAGAANRGSRAARKRKDELISAILEAAKIPARSRCGYRPWLARMTVEELREIQREVRTLVTA